jgi:hypothetical protein
LETNNVLLVKALLPIFCFTLPEPFINQPLNIMKYTAILAILACSLSGCLSTGFSEPSPIITIGEMNTPDGHLELTVFRGNGNEPAAELYALNATGGAKVPLLPEDMDKFRDMLNTALTLPPSIDSRDAVTSIGIIESYERTGLALSSTQHNSDRTFNMIAVGAYGVPRLRFSMSQDELKELNNLVVKAFKELNKESPIAIPRNQPQ